METKQQTGMMNGTLKNQERIFFQFLELNNLAMNLKSLK